MGCGHSSSATVVPAPSSSSLQANTKERINSASSHRSTTGTKSSTSQAKPNTPSLHSEHDASQNFVVIWADPNIDESKKKYQDPITKLQRLTSVIYTCKNSEQCSSYLHNVGDKKVFLIVSEAIGEQLIPLVFDESQLECIYILSEVKVRRLLWANQWSTKVKKILFDMEDVFQAIKFDSGLVGSTMPISIFRRMEVPSAIENELDQAFMYT